MSPEDTAPRLAPGTRIRDIQHPNATVREAEKIVRCLYRRMREDAQRDKLRQTTMHPKAREAITGQEARELAARVEAELRAGTLQRGAEPNSRA